ncbi:MAG: NAD(P)(+) transhydrogenase (Re/Si-specific) subunit beta, partial [Gammaproteobacteria bacterium]|nr:NAD(P)(+) transhydrogenase (Re/Si-specific) subunit beta [Gammaproteobacteria bacterium]
PYDRVFDLDEINAEFEIAEVTLIIGANDLVNPGARSDTSSPIYGMPFLNANKGKGFSGIENLLFCLHRIRILCGAGQQAGGELNHAVKELGWKNTDRAPHGGY